MSFFEKHRMSAFAADVERLRAELDVTSAKALLDIGGGTGVTTQAFAAGVPRVAVLEPDGRKRARGAKRRPSLEFLAGNAEALPLPDASFDRVTCVVAFHHFRNQEAALREMKRVLAPGGRLVIFEMSPDHSPGPFWRLIVGHTHFLEAGSLAAMIEAAGFARPRTIPSPSGYIVAAGV